jgi:GNAT superfamily N-acetyltransferase
MGPSPRLSDRILSLFTDPDKGLTLVTHGAGATKVIAMTNLMRSGVGEAEIAFLIEDEWQGRGLGRSLMRHLVSLAPPRGIHDLTATVYATNQRMLALLRGVGAALPCVRGPIMDVRLPLPPVAVSADARCH